MRKIPAALAIVIIAAAIFKIVLASRTVGTNDVLFFQAYLDKYTSDGAFALYRDGIVLSGGGRLPHPEPFQHPPFIVHLLGLLGWLQNASGLAFPLVFRLLSIVADIGSSYLVWTMLGRPSRGRQLATACVFAGSPILLFMSGFHGNTDPLMVFFLLLAVTLINRRAPAWASGAAFGMAANIKVFPVLLAPAAALYLDTWRKRIVFSAAAGAVFVLGAMPVVLEDPVFVLGRVFEYSSLYGHWGVPQFLPMLGIRSLDQFYSTYGREVLSAGILATTIWLHIKSRADLATRLGLLTSLFLLITPGFGIQYLTWLLPWLVTIGLEPLIAYSVAGGIFMFYVYTFWSKGFPWDVADSTLTGTWKGFLIWHDILAWLTVLWCSTLFARRVESSRGTPAGSDAKKSEPITSPPRQVVRKHGRAPKVSPVS